MVKLKIVYRPNKIEKEGLLLDIRKRIESMDGLSKQKRIQVHIVGFILSTVAGWVNAVGINLFLNESPSFMSGRAIILSHSLYKGDIKLFMSIVLVIVSFIMGAFFSTLITKRKGLSGGLFFASALIGLASFPISLRNIIFDTIIISMAMGAQNAATSLTPINRTTHLTGPATDIGMNMAKGNWDRVIFWCLRWVSFPLGVIIGFVLVDLHNYGIINNSTTLFLPALILISLAIVQKKFLHIPLINN